MVGISFKNIIGKYFYNLVKVKQTITYKKNSCQTIWKLNDSNKNVVVKEHCHLNFV